jgi:uncharacterized protein YajQ (UPF0234 family)
MVTLLNSPLCCLCRKATASGGGKTEEASARITEASRSNLFKRVARTVKNRFIEPARKIVGDGVNVSGENKCVYVPVCF